MSTQPDSPFELAELVTVARIARPQGIRGEVVADLLTDFPERFARLGEVHLAKPGGPVERRTLEMARLHNGRIILKLKGCDTRNEAEYLRDARVLVTRSELIKLPADTYYNFDLLDCVVSTTKGQPVGKVVDVQKYGAAPLLAVKSDEGKEFLIPLTNSICLDVDVAQKRIVIDPPEGLLDL
jgi:16S rRNA processing protein RimM